MLARIDAPQLTLGGSFTVRGTGVFTGVGCRITLEPTGADHGLVFLAPDRTGRLHRIPVSASALLTNPNHTTLVSLEDPAVQIHMVEHVLSALHGLWIDNALLTVEGGECPLNDGSARDYLEGLATVGIATLDAPRTILRVDREMEFGEGDATLLLRPPTQEGLSIRYTLDYSATYPQIGRATVVFEPLDPARYTAEIGPARTFIPVDEAERLVAAGVIRSTEDPACLVVYPDWTNHPLRVPHEYAAHKVLDLIGDLRLCGYPVWAEIIGHRSGHGLNHQAARWLGEQASRPNAT